MMNGPTNPPRLPNELISAIGVGRRVPVRNTGQRPEYRQSPDADGGDRERQHADDRRLTVRVILRRRRTPTPRCADTVPSAVGMRADDHHRDRRGDERMADTAPLDAAQRRERRDDLRRPEADAVEADYQREVQRGEAPDDRMQRAAQRDAARCDLLRFSIDAGTGKRLPRPSASAPSGRSVR